MTPKQAKILRYIASYQAMNNGVSPTLRDLCRATGTRSHGAMTGTLDRLQMQGHIRRFTGRHRSIEITKPIDMGDTGMIWGCFACLHHKIGGRLSVETKEFHTITVSMAQPTCNVCKNWMTQIEFRTPKHTAGSASTQSRIEHQQENSQPSL